MARARIIIGALLGLPRRARLTLRYQGWRELAWRLLTFPLRLTPLAPAPGPGVAADRPERARARLVPRPPAARHGRHPDLRRPGPRDRRGPQRSARPTDRERVADRGGRRRQRRSGTVDALARPRAGVEVVAGPEQRRLRRQLQPRPARRARGEDVVLLNSDVDRPPRLARVPAARGLRSGRRRRHRRPQAALPRRHDPVAGSHPQPGRARVVRPPLPLQARRPPARPTSCGPRSRSPARACTSRATSLDAIGAARRGLRHGLRGRRLLPARLGGGLPRRATAPSRRSRTWSPRPAAWCRASASSPSQRRFWERWGDWFDDRDVRARRRRPADRLRDRGHRRRRRAPRRLRAPQRPAPSAATTPSCGRWASRRTGSTCDVPGPHVRRLPRARGARSRRWTRSRSRPGGTPPRRSGRPRVRRGVPVYFVQDIETSYYADDATMHGRGARHLPPGVPLPDHVGVEPRAAARAAASSRDVVPPGRRPRPLPAAGRRARRDDVRPRARPHQPAEELPADASPRGGRCPSRGPSCGCSASSPSSPTATGVRYVDAPVRRRGQRAAQRRRPCSCRPRATRASACRSWRRWPPARPSSAPTRTATATSAATASTA